MGTRLHTLLTSGAMLCASSIGFFLFEEKNKVKELGSHVLLRSIILIFFVLLKEKRKQEATQGLF